MKVTIYWNKNVYINEGKNFIKTDKDVFTGKTIKGISIDFDKQETILNLE